MNLNNISLNNEQDECLNHLYNYLTGDNDRLIFSVDGYAGTGKTTIIAFLTSIINGNLRNKYRNIAFLTFTGKASSVLKNKLDEYNIFNENKDYSGTIHSLLYIPKLEYDSVTKVKKIIGWKKRDNLADYDLIIIDESSMVSEEILNDLLSYGIPILMFGDSFQLQPVSGKQNKYVNSPNYRLKEIHRQALDNPIIYLSKFVRENYYIPNGVFSPQVFKLDWNEQKTQDIFYNLDFFNFDNINELCILCGYNNTRMNLNKIIRNKLGFSKMPIYSGEKVMALNNDGILTNGQIGLVLFELYQPQYKMWRLDVKFDNGLIHQLFAPEKFFDKSHKYNIYDELRDLKKKYKKLSHITALAYSYVITVHKSQGSEFDKVVLFEERLPKMDDYEYARWLYTGITRAKEKLFVVSR